MLTEKVEKTIKKAAKRTKTLQFAMNIPTLGVNYCYSSTISNQSFHSASVGKLMTTTAIFIAIEMEKLSLDTRIHTILKHGELDKLFIFEGRDYQDEITVKHLLNHTSGVNDYFEGKTFEGVLFTDDVINKPEFFWKPMDLIDYTKNRQTTIASPGKRFFYSDTGYILLGLIIEVVFAKPFHQVLETFLFKPAGMKDTRLCFYSEGFDQNALAPLYLNGVDVHLFKSLSCDFSGGGLSTTAQDLLKFLNYFQNGNFVSQQSISQIAGFEHRYRQGLYYGLGMMQLRFGEFFFLLKKLPHLNGHLGMTGVHAWYDPVSKASFVMNVGNTEDMVMSFKLLIRIVQICYPHLQKS